MDDTKKSCTKADFREYQPFRGEPEVICWTCGVPKDKHRHMTASVIADIVQEYYDTAMGDYANALAKAVGVTSQPTPGVTPPPSGLNAWLPPAGSPIGSPTGLNGANSTKMAFDFFTDKLAVEHSSGNNPHTAYVGETFLADLFMYIATNDPVPHSSIDILKQTVRICKVDVLFHSGIPYGTILFC